MIPRPTTLMPLLALLLGLGGPARASERPPPPARAPAAADDMGLSPLQLTHVLQSLEQSHPLFAATRTEIDRAAGAALSARGAFDPVVTAGATTHPVGYYDWNTIETQVRAKTVAFGITPYIGWRWGNGNFPVYDGLRETTAGGELRAGLDIPLLAGSWIDSARTTRRKADRGRTLAQAELDKRRLELFRDAATAFWDWVGTGIKVEIRRQQLELAVARDTGLRRQVAAGTMAEIELVDNQRLIATRQAALLAAQRDAQRSAFELSLYLRSDDGQPRIPADGHRPASLVMPPALGSAPSLEHVIEGALARRPEVRAQATKLGNAELDLRLAKNQRLPSLSAKGYVAKDFGPGPAQLQPAELGVGVAFEMPLLLRSGRGQVAQAHAAQRRITHELQYTRDRIAVEVRTAFMEMTTARQRAEIAHTQVDLAQRLAAAERSRFDLGDSTILVLNLREEAAADAAAARVDALVDYRKARARYQVAAGLPPHE